MIKLVRLDYRLLHGQVVFSWTGHVGAQRIIVVDDDAANDEMKKSALLLSKPAGVRVNIFTVDKAIAKMLTEGGLKAMVDFAFSGEDCAAHKPAPDIYLKALKALGLTADKAIAVEDSPTGIASAKAAGLKVLALKPRHGEPLDQSAADCIITKLMDVKEHLD